MQNKNLIKYTNNRLIFYFIYEHFLFVNIIKENFFNGLGAREGGKKSQKKGQKNEIFFVLNKYESVTHVPISIFQGLFRNIVFRCIASVTKKLWAILDFAFNLNIISKIHII